ncbi:MAG: hypothetical protein CBC71_06230 [Rhodobacteraceae bacterium TMED111]|nr:hypothetical protein [Marinovum sp.]OUV41096.1 MAG: hypothetical protein CBC71_06230 [Rhodobacteraceae bacterium TMED111]|tara:strand:- start:19695 stop:19880 length:186 start_codon:yes stop_codon:yes gene_type:complete
MQKKHLSRFGEISEFRTADSLQRFYSRLGHDAERAKDHALAHTYFQHADHYAKLEKAEKQK